MKWIPALASILLAYGLLSLAIGWSSIAEELSLISADIWLFSILIVTLGYGLMFIRWQILLTALGHPLNNKASGSIFIAGLGLITAPARSGEALRGLWLHQRHQIPVQVGVAATGAERMLDLISALMVLGWGLGQGLQQLSILIIGTFLTGLTWLSSHPKLISSIKTTIEKDNNRLETSFAQRILRLMLRSLLELRLLFRPRTLISCLTLSISVWLLESSLVRSIFEHLGKEFSLEQTSVIRTATSLGGALSFLPGGLVGSEATSIGVAIAYGASRDQSVTATIILRFATLLLPCAIGTFWIGKLNKNGHGGVDVCDASQHDESS